MIPLHLLAILERTFAAHSHTHGALQINTALQSCSASKYEIA
jgi:hypothetical protein